MLKVPPVSTPPPESVSVVVLWTSTSPVLLRALETLNVPACVCIVPELFSVQP